MERIYLHGDEDHVVEILSLTDDVVHFEFQNKRYKVFRNEFNSYHLNGDNATCMVSNNIVTVNGNNVDLEAWKLSRGSGNDSASGDMLSPMPGKILKLCVEPGQKIEAGDSLVIMEAMKMEHTIKSTVNGTLVNFHVNVGQLIEGGKELFEIEVEA
jgi:3-methylcrotonyl-CoA carboxylase alpha subunit